MNIELEKFITDLDEYLKNKSVELDGNGEHIKRLCRMLGGVEVSLNVELRPFGGRTKRYCLVGSKGRDNIKIPFDKETFPHAEDVKNIKMKLGEVIDLSCLEKEITSIVTGARADIIYEYEAFVEDFVKTEETGEIEED